MPGTYGPSKKHYTNESETATAEQASLALVLCHVDKRQRAKERSSYSMHMNNAFEQLLLRSSLMQEITLAGKDAGREVCRAEACKVELQ